MVKKLIVAACIEAALLAVGAMIEPEFLQENGVWVALAAMAVLLLIAIYEWWSARKRSGGDGGANQTSHGPMSPNISGPFESSPVTVGDTYAVFGAPGGNTFGRVDKLQIGQGQFELTQAVLENIAAQLRKRPSKPIKMEGIGGGRSERMAAQIRDYLRKEGFEVDDHIDQTIFAIPAQEVPIHIRYRSDDAIISVDARIPI